jgi:hypothetical protein
MTNDEILMAAKDSGTFTKETILQQFLLIPTSFFYDDLSNAPVDVWGYVGRVVRKAHSDRPACVLKFLDGETQFYINEHPKARQQEKHRYLNSPSVKKVSNLHAVQLAKFKHW